MLRHLYWTEMAISLECKCSLEGSSCTQQALCAHVQAPEEAHVTPALCMHRKEVTSLAMHPSGRLALSTGNDAMLRLWNLVKGRCQYKARLEQCSQVGILQAWWVIQK